MKARRAALALIAVALVAGAVAPSAGAHETLLRSEPTDASSTAKPPRRVQLWFSGGLAPSGTAVTLRDAAGRAVAGTRLDLSAARAGTAVLVLPRLERGVYSLDWRVRFAGDLHLAEGAISFGVGARAVPVRERDPAGSVEGVDVLFRWLGFLCLAGVVGGLAVATVVFGRVVARGGPASAAAERARARALGCAAAGAGGSAVVGIGVLVAQASSPGSAWALLGGTRWGWLWVAREVLALALFGALVRRSRRGVRSAVMALALALVGVQALSGHALDLATNQTVAVVAAVVHLLAALAWVGGVLAAVVSLWPLLGRRRREAGALARACLAPFGVLAAGCVSLLAVTGLYYAGRQVASLDALLTTLYGQALIGKLGLALGAAALGSVNARILRRSALDAARLRPFLAGEAALGLAVLLAVGVLTTTPPARGPAFAPAPASAPSYLTGSADDLLVSLSVRPNRPGVNLFQVGAVSTRRPAPAAIERVRLRFTGPQGSVTSPPLREVGPGRYRSSGSYLSVSGDWRVEALVDRTGLGERRAGFAWTVASAGAPPPVVVSRRPLEPILTSAAAALLLGLVAAWALVLARRLPRRPGFLFRQRLEERVE
jgi:copper transport protein